MSDTSAALVTAGPAATSGTAGPISPSKADLRTLLLATDPISVDTLSARVTAPSTAELLDLLASILVSKVEAPVRLLGPSYTHSFVPAPVQIVIIIMYGGSTQVS